MVGADECDVRIEHVGDAVADRVAAAAVAQRDRVAELLARLGDARDAAVLAGERLHERNVGRRRRHHAVGASRWTAGRRRARFVGEVHDLRNACGQRIGDHDLHREHQAAVRRHGQATPGHRSAGMAAAVGGRQERDVRIEHVGDVVAGGRRPGAVAQRDRVGERLTRLGRGSSRLQRLGQRDGRVDRRHFSAVVRHGRAVDVARDGYGVRDRCTADRRVHLHREGQNAAGARREIECERVPARRSRGGSVAGEAVAADMRGVGRNRLDHVTGEQRRDRATGIGDREGIGQDVAGRDRSRRRVWRAVHRAQHLRDRDLGLELDRERAGREVARGIRRGVDAMDDDARRRIVLVVGTRRGRVVREDQRAVRRERDAGPTDRARRTAEQRPRLAHGRERRAATEIEVVDVLADREPSPAAAVERDVARARVGRRVVVVHRADRGHGVTERRGRHDFPHFRTRAAGEQVTRARGVESAAREVR